MIYHEALQGDYRKEQSLTNHEKTYKMKEEYDFSNAEQGRFYVPIEDIQLPIYLDKDVFNT